ncbi:LYR motif containing protein 1 isoform X3 [Rhinoraja longicauda]
MEEVSLKSMTAATRNEVLGLYRRIFRIARTWQSLTGLTDDSSKEKQYIVMEAKALFKKNKNLTDAEAIKNCITECHTRIEMGLHYRIPYPRPANHPQIELHDYTGSYAFTYQGSNFYNSHSKSLYFSCRYIYLLWDLLIKKDASLKCKRG